MPGKVKNARGKFVRPGARKYCVYMTHAHRINASAPRKRLKRRAQTRKSPGISGEIAGLVPKASDSTVDAVGCCRFVRPGRHARPHITGLHSRAQRDLSTDARKRQQ